MERGLYICGGITAVFGMVAYGLVPITGMVNAPTTTIFFGWMTFMVFVGACHVLWATLRMALRRVDRPVAALIGMLNWKQIISIVVWSVLLALNLMFFCTLKAQLGQIVPFTADPLLADIDKMLLGSDAWRLTEWFNHEKLSIIYHRAWFLWLAFVIFYLCKQPASFEKDRLLVGYVLMWSIFGPVVHLLLPAAGPVFYSELGYGDRFLELDQSARSLAVKAYLWDGYVNKTFYPASGISAMPSLHLATMFWSLIVIRKSRWIIFGWLFTAYIFIGSIAIGWHYAIDGIAGGIGAVLCYWLAGFKFRGSEEPGPVASPEYSGAVVTASCRTETV
jgi:hypothetical protein